MSRTAVACTIPRQHPCQTIKLHLLSKPAKRRQRRVALRLFGYSVRGHRPALTDLAREFVTLARAPDPSPPVRVHPRIVPKEKITAVTLEDG
ncbi:MULTISPECIES: hypothetical protein [unclassified Methylobacterium]|uniref:hypothetical protein n=1 Tax=unclassified Methylobacterium TaxID=2615210 RepID=UPI00226A418C|nr:MULTISPECIES: hypothetical protein [unclassified Methylobacterium]